MSYGLVFTEHFFSNLHLTYIKNNCIILRENGIADCIYKVKLDLQFDSANTYFDIADDEDQDDEEISNYDIQPLLNLSPLSDDKHLIDDTKKRSFTDKHYNPPPFKTVLFIGRYFKTG
ncbi:hypothetical protein ACO0OL_000816 [Hanseniaspora opuntiae]